MTLRGPGQAFGRWRAVKLKKRWITATDNLRAVSHLVGHVEMRQLKLAHRFDLPPVVLQFRIQTACSGRRWCNFKTRIINCLGHGQNEVVVSDESASRHLSDEPVSRVCERCRTWAYKHQTWLWVTM